MTLLHRLRHNPIGDMGQYLAGTGYLMLAGGVALTAAFTASRGQVGTLALALCLLAALVNGYQGLRAMVRFMRSGETPVNSAMLAIATGFFALLTGGLFGLFASAAIGRMMQTAI